MNHDHCHMAQLRAYSAAAAAVAAVTDLTEENLYCFYGFDGSRWKEGGSRSTLYCRPEISNGVHDKHTEYIHPHLVIRAKYNMEASQMFL